MFSPLFRAKKCLALLRGTSKFSQRKTPTHYPNLGDVSVPLLTLENMAEANLGTLQHTFLVCLFALANKLRETHKKQKGIRVKMSKDAESTLTLTPACTRQTVINGLLLSPCSTTSAARGGFSTSRKQYGLFGPLHNGQSH